LGNLSTPKSVQKLQKALHAKAKAEAGYRFYALYDKISREDILAHAYAQCRSDKGAPGVDGQDFADIEAYGVQRWLGELALALRQETYRPDPIRRVYIPKANGKLRPLGISTLRDRVCMTAAMLVLEPIFEADLPPRTVYLSSRAQCPTGGGRGGSAAVPRPSGSRRRRPPQVGGPPDC
jgi:RNA-directed DNA polymerase